MFDAWLIYYLDTEALATEKEENIEQMFPWYHMHNDVWVSVKS